MRNVPANSIVAMQMRVKRMVKSFKQKEHCYCSISAANFKRSDDWQMQSKTASGIETAIKLSDMVAKFSFLFDVKSFLKT